MGFKCGIVGLPNVGKSTIFNALTAAGAQAENFPFCTIEPNTGVVPVPDERLEKLAQIYNSKEVIPTKLTFVDVAGLIKGASKGEGLGNQFLGHIRNVDAIAHVVRCFQDENVVHIHGEINPISDIEIIETELVLADLELTEKQIAKYAKLAKSGDKKVKEILANLERLKELLSKGVWLAKAVCELELDNLGWFFPTLLTVKPLILVANVSEESLNKENDPVLLKVREYAESRSIPLVELCGELEAQLSQLELEEKKSFLQELNIKESGLEKLIKTGYSALNLITFFTAGPKESRAWTVVKGTKAPQAGGKIHTDFEKGFIRAEVISYNDLINAGSDQKARELGKVRLEGKEYEVQDGDVIYFRFNV